MACMYYLCSVILCTERDGAAVVGGREGIRGEWGDKGCGEGGGVTDKAFLTLASAVSQRSDTRKDRINKQGS